MIRTTKLLTAAALAAGLARCAASEPLIRAPPPSRPFRPSGALARSPVSSAPRAA